MTLALALFAPAFAVLCGFLFAGLLCAAWLWALVDCLQSRFRDHDKLVWALVILLVPLIGYLLYFIIVRGQKISPGESGQR